MKQIMTFGSFPFVNESFDHKMDFSPKKKIYNPYGIIERHEVKCVVKGFNPTPRKDFIETFSLVVKSSIINVIFSLVKLSTINVIFSLVVSNVWDI